jgi:nickel-dependent lactate racemase
MDILIPYGSTYRTAIVPDDAVVIRPKHTQALADEHSAFLASLRNPIGSAPLAERVRASDRVAIVISDITRATPNERIVPWLLEELAFVPRSHFVILNGTGSHRANTRAELVQMLGEEIVDTVEIVNHDAFDPQTLIYLGQTTIGTPIWVDRRYHEADFRIATGFIEPHFFAGFSGGAKGIIPGLAGIETIKHLHSASLVGHPRSTWAIIEGNPLHHGIQQAVSLCPPEFMTNVTLDQEQHITGVYSGHYIQAHYKGCEEVMQSATQAVERPFDIIITSNSGYPLAQNLYQTVKGMTAAAQIVRPGGSIVTIAECRDGLPEHGNYKALLQMRATPAALLEMINEPGFQMHDQWQVQKQALVQELARVYLHSSLPDNVVYAAKLIPAPDLQNTIERLLLQYGSHASIAVLPEGPLTVPYVPDYSHTAS